MELDRGSIPSKGSERIFFFAIASRSALGPTQPIQWLPGALSLCVKRQLLEADHSPPSSAEVRGAIRPLPHSSSWRGN